MLSIVENVEKTIDVGHLLFNSEQIAPKVR